MAAYDQVLASQPGGRVIIRAARDELTDTAADAAVDQACRIVRLPTIRTGPARSPQPRPASRPATKGSWSSSWRSNATTGRPAARPRLGPRGRLPVPSGWRTSTTPASAWVAAGQPWCLR
jgi:hypothetical protein